MTILFRECAGAKVVGIADASGCAEDPDGLSRSELARLVACALPVAAFDPQLLSARGAVYDAATDAGASMRDSMHNRVKSDVFVPASSTAQRGFFLSLSLSLGRRFCACDLRSWYARVPFRSLVSRVLAA